MQAYKKGDIVTHPRTGLIELRVVSPPDSNGGEFMVVEYQNGLECISIQDRPSMFKLKSIKLNK